MLIPVILCGRAGRSGRDCDAPVCFAIPADCTSCELAIGSRRVTLALMTRHPATAIDNLPPNPLHIDAVRKIVEMKRQGPFSVRRHTESAQCTAVAAWQAWRRVTAIGSGSNRVRGAESTAAGPEEHPAYDSRRVSHRAFPVAGRPRWADDRSKSIARRTPKRRRGRISR
jgi:hypothetical protein